MRMQYTSVPAMSDFSLRAFTQDQLKAIHNSVLYILEKVGLKVQSEMAAEFLKIKTTLDSLATGPVFGTPYTGDVSTGTTKLKGS